MEQIVVYPKKNKQLIVFGLVILIVFAGLWLFITKINDFDMLDFSLLTVFGYIQWIIILVVAAGLIIFGIIGIISLIISFFHPKPLLIINEKGIIEKSNKKDLRLILWSEIKSIDLMKKKIVIGLTPDSCFLKKYSNWIRWLLKTDQYPNGRLELNLFFADVSAFEVYDIIQSYLSKHRK